MADNLKMTILVSGEHLIGETVEHEDGSATIVNPVSMMPDPNSQGQRLMFMPYTQFFEGDEATFKERDIRHIVVPEESIAKNWKKQFEDTGIVMPDEKKLILG